MKVIREKTVWEDDTPNHDYAVNDAGKCVGYRKAGTDEWLMFKTPKSFSRSRRSFTTLKDDPLVCSQ